MDAATDFLKMFHVEASQSSVTLSLLLVFLGLLCWYSVYPFSVLSRCGISHPKPSPFFGNLFLFREGFYKPLQDLVAKHGKVFGYYMGRKPTVVIADPDILRQVMVKDFNSFPNRLSTVITTKPMSDSLLFLKDDTWRRVRSILTPSFSAAKMKEMVPLINTASDVLMTNLSVYAESGESFDIYKCFGCFTMDVIASVAFGTHVDSQNHVDDPFVRHAKMFFSFTFFKPLMLLFMAFPVIAPLVQVLPNHRRDTMNQFFSSTIRKIIQQREELPPEQRRRDFLQMMLDARTSKDVTSLEDFDTAHPAAEHKSETQQATDLLPQQDVDQNGHQQRAPSARPQRKTISEDEIVGQSFVFLVAGYETSSNTLGFTCYLLAKHPECQRRAQEELDRFFARHGSVDYENIQELKYLDMVISETLRLYPPALRYGRVIERDQVVNGVSLPNGATLEIPAICLHRDPEHWPDPDKFDPERFTPEAKAARHPFVYLPFGAGPRNCVGMRVAQLEMKMALARLLHTFNIATCAETEDPLELSSFTTLGPKNGIFVKIQKRDVSQHPSDSTAEE